MSDYDRFDMVYTKLVMMIGRTLHWKQKLAELGSKTTEYDGNVAPKSIAGLDREYGGTFQPEANLISSKLPNGNHAPAIDIDLMAHLVPSSTPGHFHLYFDKEMTWKDYEKLLRVMTEVGLVEQGFYSTAMRFKQTYLRLPHVKKTTGTGDK